MAELLRVVVHGVLGRMGREVLAALCGAEDLKPVGGIDLKASDDHLPLPNGRGSIPLSSSGLPLLRQVRPQVMVDFSVAEGTMAVARQAIPLGVNLVVGTTGLSEGNLQELDTLAREHRVGALVAPNFALGAVLLIQLARSAARFFEYADIIEAHHEAKIDAPSGTALAIARALAEGRGGAFQHPAPTKEPLPGTRGGEFQGIGIHALRMVGRMAHHEVVLGAAGQTLSIRHDTVSRECYMPGVLMAVREVVRFKGLKVGLETILGL